MHETAVFNHIGAVCPACGVPGKLSPHSDYGRGLVSWENGRVTDSTIRPLRFKCASCTRTHALLPDIITPYSPYSLRFKLEVLIAYFQRDTTAANICEQFGISPSTLYTWKGRLLFHRKLLYRAFAAFKTPALAFLCGLFNHTAICADMRNFFMTYGFSFMQRRSLAATQTPP